MHGIRRFYIDTEQGQLHGRRLAARSPERPPLICLHPAPSSSLYFTTAMPLINARRDVVAPDYPGFGGSDKPECAPVIADYAAAIGALLDADNGPVDLFGFHTGCLVASEIAIAHPESVRRTVMCDVPYFSGETQARLREQMARPLPLDAELACLSDAWDVDVSKRLADVPLPRAFELFVEHLRAAPDDHLAFAAAFGYDCEARFAALDADVVVLATQSGLLEPSRSAAAAIPGARLVEVPEVTTAVFEAGADAIADRLLGALDD